MPKQRPALSIVSDDEEEASNTEVKNDGNVDEGEISNRDWTQM